MRNAVGELNDIRLLSPDTTDLVLGTPIKFGIGYGLKVDSQPYVPEGHVCVWGGGSVPHHIFVLHYFYVERNSRWSARR